MAVLGAVRSTSETGGGAPTRPVLNPICGGYPTTGADSADPTGGGANQGEFSTGDGPSAAPTTSDT